MNSDALYYHAEIMKRYIEALGMYTENLEKLANGEAISFTSGHFYNLAYMPF